MTLHLCAFRESLGIPTGSDLVNINAVLDGYLPVQGDGLLLPQNLSIVAAWAGTSVVGNTDFVRLQSPALTRVGYPNIVPVDGTVPANIAMDNAIQPLSLRAGETLQTWTQYDTGAIDLDSLVWLHDQFTEVPPGGAFWLRYRNSAGYAPAATDVWQADSPIFDEQLPQGRYGIVGIFHVQTDTLAARLILPKTPMRPGVLAVPALNTQQARMFDTGNFGVYGEFDSFAPPTIEMLRHATATMGATYQGYLRVVRLGDAL